MSVFIGDFPEDSTVRVFFNTFDTGGEPVAPSSAFAAADFAIYKNGSATQKTSTNGITVTSPFDSVVGLHLIEIDTSNDTGDAGFWTAAAEFELVFDTAKTVDSLSIDGVAFRKFSIENRNVDVNVTQVGGQTASASAAVDFDNLVSPPELLVSTTISLYSSPTIFRLTAGSADNDAYNGAIVVVTDQSTGTQKAVGRILDYAGPSRQITLVEDPGIFTFAVGDFVDVIAATGASKADIQAECDDALTAFDFSSKTVGAVSGAVGSVTGNVGGNVVGSVGSVTAGVTVTTNNDKTGYSLTQAFPSNFASLGINVSGHVSRVTLVDTTTTNTDMRGTDSAATAGDAMTLTAGERTTLAAAIEAAIINELDGTAVMQAIADLIADDMTTGDLTVQAIAAAARDAILNRVLSGNHDTAGTTGKILQDVFVDTGTTLPATLTTINNAVASVDGKADDIYIDTQAIAADTTVIRGDLENGGRLDLIFDNINANVDSVNTQVGSLATTAALSAVAANVTSILAVSVKLDTGLEVDGSGGYQWTILALENAPSGGGGGGTATLEKQEEILTAIGNLNDPSAAEIVAALSGNPITIVGQTLTTTYLELIRNRDYDDVAHTKRRWTIDTGTIDLTGFTGTATFRDEEYNAIATCDVEVENAGLSTQGIAMTVPRATFASQRTGRRYHFDITLNDGSVYYTPILGEFNLIREITAV